MKKTDFFMKMNEVMQEDTQCRAEADRLLLIRRICDEERKEKSEWRFLIADLLGGKSCDETCLEEFEYGSIDLQAMGVDEGEYGFKLFAEAIRVPGYQEIGHAAWYALGNEGNPTEEEEESLGEKICLEAIEAISKENRSKQEEETLSFVREENCWLLEYAGNQDCEKELLEVALEAGADVYNECSWREFCGFKASSKAMGVFHDFITSGGAEKKDADEFARHVKRITGCEVAYDSCYEEVCSDAIFSNGEFTYYCVYRNDGDCGIRIPFAFGLVSFEFLCALEKCKQFLERMDKKYGFLKREGDAHEADKAA